MGKETIDVIVGGETGYGGQGIIDRLADHPYVDKTIAFSRDLPEPRHLKSAQAAILALPHEEGGYTALYLHALGKTVIDLAGSFRQPAGIYRQRYHREHVAPQLLPGTAYGLVELERQSIREKDLIAAPGCYPTAIGLALRPLVDSDLIIKSRPIKIEAESGGTGRGRKRWEKEGPAFKAAGKTEEYARGRQHQHVGEIEQFLGGRRISLRLSLAPRDRGIDAQIKPKFRKAVRARDVHETLESTYYEEPLVKVLPLGQQPCHDQVDETDSCHIGVVERDGQIVVCSSIDNLGKGMAGQGVQILNVRFGFPETAGLRVAEP